jgi:hypothetical protein
MKREGISEAEVRASAEALDWGRLAQHLRHLSPDSGTVKAVSLIVLRCRGLIHRYPDPRRKSRRDEFLKHLSTWADRVGEPATVASLQSDLEVISLAERGYASIRTALAQTAAARLPADQRAAALLSLGAHDVNWLFQELGAKARACKTTEPMALALEDEDGSHFSGDDIVSRIDVTTGAALALYAQQEGWIASDDAIVLPPLVAPRAEHRAAMRKVVDLAEAWSLWRNLEERRRYDGGDFAISEIDGPPGATLVQYQPPPEAVTWERITVAGYERLNADIYSIFHELAFRTGARETACGLDGDAELLPTNHLSLCELESARALDWLMSTEIEAETTRYLGLRLVEWLRCYTALSMMAQCRLDPDNPDSLVWTVTAMDLRHDLERLGLRRSEAERFIDLATYRRSSADMIDEPLIRASDGRLIVFGPCLVSAVPARIILSKLTRAGVALGRRGKRFEHEVRDWFASWGHPALAITARRRGQDYEFDAIVPWDNYVFVFECKSRGHVAPNAVQRHHARERFRGYVAQATRLADALRNYPDILDEHLGPASGPRKIVTCVLNALPFAFPREADGVLVSDLASLGLFFERGALTLSATHVLPGVPSLQQILASRPFWSGRQPTSEDFVRFLADAPLAAVMLARLKSRMASVSLGPAFRAEGPYVYCEPESLEETARIIGADASALRHDLAAVADALGHAGPK